MWVNPSRQRLVCYDQKLTGEAVTDLLIELKAELLTFNEMKVELVMIAGECKLLLLVNRFFLDAMESLQAIKSSQG